MLEMIQLKNGCLFETNSKLLKGNYSRWLASSDCYLHQVYGRYSANKEYAMNYCFRLYNELNGERIRIISHNCMVFTVGFEFDHPTTGECCFAYITRDYNRFIRLSNI